MAQQTDPFAEFAVEDDDPFAEFTDPVLPRSQPVVSAKPEPNADDILRDAATSLTAANTLAPPPSSPTLSTYTEETPKSNWWDRLVQPLTDAPSRVANWASDKLTETNKPTGIAPLDYVGDLALKTQQGLLKGVGALATGLTSPDNLAAIGLTGGASLLGKGAAKNLAMKAAQGAAAIPVAHGVTEIVNPESTMPERFAGAAEAGLGALGMRGFGKTVIPNELPIREAEEGLLRQADYEFNARPDSPLPDLETYVITGNQATPGRALPPTGIKKIMGSTEVTDAAGNVIARPVTTQRPIIKDAPPQVLDTIAEAAEKRAPVPTYGRISPEKLSAMPEKPAPTGDPELDKATWADYASIPRAIQSAYDLSMPFRQGLGLIHTKGWWKAWPDMVKSLGSDGAYRSVMDSVLERPNYKPGANGLSFAQEAGLEITDLGKLAKREEEFGSRLAERVPFIGKGVKVSNRAANAFINKLRADNFDSLIDQARAAGLDPKKDLTLAKEIANFVNTASGRGKLSGKFEQTAVALNQMLFSPRLMASRLQMMNPRNYVFGNPMVRKQYLKSALALGTFWNGIAELSKLGGAEVNNDPNSSDFRQIKIGDTRIDPSGGFRPYIVLASRLSEMFEKDSDRYTGKFGARTPVSDLTDFMENKLAPNAAYLTGPVRANDKFPFYAGDETVKLFTPIIVQDIVEMLRENPEALGYAVPANLVGFGTNTYQPGREEEPRMTEGLFPKQYDLRFPR